MSPANSTTPSAAETGSTLAEFETGSGTHKLLLALMPLVSALFVGVWIYSLALWDWKFNNAGFIAVIVGTVLLLGLAAPFLVGWLLALSALRWRLLLCQNGILVCKRRSSRWIPWQGIARYYEKNVVINGVSTGHQINFQLKNGKKASIEVLFKDPAAIAQGIKDHLVPALVSEAETDLSRGQAVDFKFLQLSRHGLQTKTELIPWKDVQSIAIEDNKGLSHQVRVRASGKKRPLIDVPVTSFPNVEVFFHLVEQVQPTDRRANT